MFVDGNERPDQIAKATGLRTSHACPFSFGDLFPSIRFAIPAAWQTRWEGIMTITKMEIAARAVHPWPCTNV